MSATAAVAAGAIGGALQAGGGLIGQLFTNKANKEMTEQTNLTNYMIQSEVNAAQLADAERNRRFQERMSNTAHQREIADLEAAGLNPILSVNQNGAFSPQGNTSNLHAATMSAPQFKNPIPPELINSMLVYKLVDRLMEKNDENSAKAAAVYDDFKHDLRSKYYRDHDIGSIHGVKQVSPVKFSYNDNADNLMKSLVDPYNSALIYSNKSTKSYKDYLKFRNNSKNISDFLAKVG